MIHHLLRWIRAFKWSKHNSQYVNAGCMEHRSQAPHNLLARYIVVLESRASGVSV
jgi:hypothetical protein